MKSKKLFLTVVTVVLAVTLFAGCTLNDSMQWVSKNKLEQVKQQVKLKIAPDPTDPSKLEIYNFNEPILGIENKMLTQTISNVRVAEDFDDIPEFNFDRIINSNFFIGKQIIPEGDVDNITYRLSDEYYFIMYDCELLWTEKTDYIREDINLETHYILLIDPKTNQISQTESLNADTKNYIDYTPVSGDFEDIDRIYFYDIMTNQPLKITYGGFIQKSKVQEYKEKGYQPVLCVGRRIIGEGAAWDKVIKLSYDLFTIE